MFPLKVLSPLFQIFKQENVISTLYRNCSDLSIVKTQLEVPTFCDIHVDVACKVRVKPLNIHKYHNLNAFLLQTDQKYDNAIEHYIDGNKVIIKGHENLNPNTLCSIKAPVKANLEIIGGNDVSVGFFHGDKVKVKTEGNVFVDRFQGDSVDISTTNGNIILNNYIQASNISAVTKNGSIISGRLQSLNLKLKTLNKGDISVESSYCSESIFVVEHGNMNLNNIHKDCKIFLIKGNLFLGGFDGQLSAILNSGSAEVYLSRITGHSDIILKDAGILDLKISDSCQDYNKFKIMSPNVSLSGNLKSEVARTDNLVILKPNCDSEKMVLVDCANSSVKVESTSWQDMIKMKLNK